MSSALHYPPTKASAEESPRVLCEVGRSDDNPKLSYHFQHNPTSHKRFIVGKLEQKAHTTNLWFNASANLNSNSYQTAFKMRTVTNTDGFNNQ